MALFPLTLPVGKPSAFDALKSRGYAVRWQDAGVVIEADDEALALEAQAFLDTYDLAPELQAALLLAVDAEAARRIEIVVGPQSLQINATAQGVSLCWKAIRALQTVGDPEPEPELTVDEFAAAEELIGTWVLVTAIRAASVLVKDDVLALTGETDLQAFNPATSPRWPYVSQNRVLLAAAGTFTVRRRDMSFHIGIPATDAVIDGQPGSWVVAGEATLIKSSVMPVWSAANVGQVGNGLLSVAINYTPGLAAGDLAIIQVHSDNATFLVIDEGWLPVGNQTYSFPDNLFGSRLWWRILSGAESGSVTVSRSGSGASNLIMGTMHLVKNAKATNGYPFEGYTSVYGNSTDLDGVAVTTSGSNRLVVQAWNVGDNLDLGSAGDGYNQRVVQIKTQGNGGALAWDDRQEPTATTVAAPARSIIAAHPYVAHGFAILPVGALSNSSLPSSPGVLGVVGQDASLVKSP